MVGKRPALLAVPYAAKERHTSLSPPQPLGILSLMICIEIINRDVFALLKENRGFLLNGCLINSFENKF